MNLIIFTDSGNFLVVGCDIRIPEHVARAGQTAAQKNALPDFDLEPQKWATHAALSPRLLK